ncbi:MAG: enoyl-CoA hydratase/isomerase family protein [Deltaproteobacteria bacterium]|uniref:Enoyl-CoA hydratase/isomerase family protein n=1 Tax=Candidatus Zymogenus saltonus TaxID=2844893 RepID=A0A9D8KBS3_9DELT|nr:enoyl-CoA hydratase/isomerase family protein [Candidatus Zymogenus saltonus]
MTDYKTLIFEEPEKGIALVTFNRPESLNAIDTAMLDDFDNLFDRLNHDDSIRVLVLTGKGRGFNSGADLQSATAHKDAKPFSDPEIFLKMVQERYASVILGLRRIPQPVIAAVNGPAAGGGFCITLASDIRIAAPEAFFLAPFINIGLTGGELGTTYFLPRLVGLSNATDIVMTGRRVPADEALRIGLVSKVVPLDSLVGEALEVAKVLLQKTRGALKLTKRALDQNVNAPSLETALDLENRNQTLMVFSGAFFDLIKSFA